MLNLRPQSQNILLYIYIPFLLPCLFIHSVRYLLLSHLIYYSSRFVYSPEKTRERNMGSSGFSWKLADHPKLPKGKTVGLVVLDGWGEANPDNYNCIHVAETPTMDSLKKVSFFFFRFYFVFFVFRRFWFCFLGFHGSECFFNFLNFYIRLLVSWFLTQDLLIVFLNSPIDFWISGIG